MRSRKLLVLSGALVVLSPTWVGAESSRTSESSLGNTCAGLPSQSTLRAALKTAATTPVANNGFHLLNWATVVNRDGIVCAVAFQGNNRGDQWPGSRVISAQKASTANSFSLPGLALSTANIFF